MKELPFRQTILHGIETRILLYQVFQPRAKAKGDLFRRQSEKAEEWAKLQWLPNHKRLERPRPIRLSGLEHQGKGDFGEFLRAAEAKELPRESMLLVENLYRVSRDTPRKWRSRIFLRVLGTGIGIFTLTDPNRSTRPNWSMPISTGMKLFGALMVMIRAHGESQAEGGAHLRLVVEEARRGPREVLAAQRPHSRLADVHARRNRSADIRPRREEAHQNRAAHLRRDGARISVAGPLSRA